MSSGISPSLSDWVHSVWKSVGPSVLLRTTLPCPFSLLSSILPCVCILSSWSICHYDWRWYYVRYSSYEQHMTAEPCILGLEKVMATHSSPLAWKIPWTEELGGLQSMESLRVGHDWVTSLSLFTFMHWRRKWQPTPVFLDGESQGWGSLVGCRLWGRTGSDTTEAT